MRKTMMLAVMTCLVTAACAPEVESDDVGPQGAVALTELPSAVWMDATFREAGPGDDGLAAGCEAPAVVDYELQLVGMPVVVGADTGITCDTPEDTGGAWVVGCGRDWGSGYSHAEMTLPKEMPVAVGTLIWTSAGAGRQCEWVYDAAFAPLD